MRSLLGTAMVTKDEWLTQNVYVKRHGYTCGHCGEMVDSLVMVRVVTVTLNYQRVQICGACIQRLADSLMVQ